MKFLERMQPDEKVIVFVRSKCIHGWSDPGERELDMGGGDNSLKVGFLGRFLSDHCIKVF